jgi:hypothetical protein
LCVVGVRLWADTRSYQMDTKDAEFGSVDSLPVVVVELELSYNLVVDRAGEGKARIAGGIGDGERPKVEK